MRAAPGPAKHPPRRNVRENANNAEVPIEESHIYREAHEKGVD
jgi:hypothetical protein